MVTGRPRLLALFAEPLIDLDGRPVSGLRLEEERGEIAGWLEGADLDIDFAQFLRGLSVG